MDKIESSVKVASDDNAAINELFIIKNIAFKESGKKTYEFIDLWLFATELSEEAYEALEKYQEISKEMEDWLSVNEIVDENGKDGEDKAFYGEKEDDKHEEGDDEGEDLFDEI